MTMKAKRGWIPGILLLGVAAGGVYLAWKRSQRGPGQVATLPPDEARAMLERAAPLLQLPTSPGRVPEVLTDGSGLRCPATGRVYPYRDNVLYLLGDQQDKTFTQHALDTPFTAWAYDRFRSWITWSLGVPDFPAEVVQTQRTLQVKGGDVLLDLACGHGIFTVEWAKRAGKAGLVIGLDYSEVMLQRAAHHASRWGLSNVLLVHGDAHALPLADRALDKLSCSGGFHQFPDLPQALHELARVSAPGAVLATSTFAEGPDDPRAALKRWLKHRFALHFVPLVPLGEQLAALGFEDYTWSLPGRRWFGYASARKGRAG